LALCLIVDKLLKLLPKDQRGVAILLFYLLVGLYGEEPLSSQSELLCLRWGEFQIFEDFGAN